MAGSIRQVEKNPFFSSGLEPGTFRLKNSFYGLSYTNIMNVNSNIGIHGMTGCFNAILAHKMDISCKYSILMLQTVKQFSCPLNLFRNMGWKETGELILQDVSFSLILSLSL